MPRRAGVIERRRLFFIPALAQELPQRRSLPAEGMVIDFSNRLDQEAGSLSPKDDLTMVMLELK